MRRDGQKWIFDSFVGMAGLDAIFPDAYIAWSETGLYLKDYLLTMSRVRSGDMLSKSWRKTAEQLEIMAQEASGRGHRETAGDLYYRAALCYARAFWPISDILGRPNAMAAYAKVKECYDLAAQTVDYVVERIEAPFEATSIPGIFHRPRHANGRLPCVIYIPGMDGVKDIFPDLRNNPFIRRGLALVTIDGPGVGESLLRGLHVTLSNVQRAVSAVIDYLEGRPDVDPDRIAMLGMSMGSYWGPSSAAEDQRIKCCVAALGCLMDKTTMFDKAPPAYKANFMTMAGIKDEETFDKVAREMTLERYADHIECPMLIMNGEFDQLCPIEDARRLMSLLHCPRELWIFENEFHPIGRWRSEVFAWAADWLRDALNGRYDPRANREVFIHART
jgi:dienelactone hydrolase